MKKYLYIIIFAGAFLLGILLWNYQNEPAASKPANQALPEQPLVSAMEAILIDGTSGQVLYEKNADKKGYPASTTKIMTALVTLDICREQNIDTSQTITIPEEAQGVEGSSMYLKAGEKKSIEDLLYGIMLVSGNDGATALALKMGGAGEGFVKRMNERAEELGCTGTHFENPTGLFDENHYTTARDLANIAMEAMKNPVFSQIVCTTSWKNYHNKNKSLYEYQGGNGVKIGYTKRSGRTLVASAKRNGVQLICVVLNDGNWFNDAYQLLDYGFSIKEYRDETN